MRMRTELAISTQINFPKLSSGIKWPSTEPGITSAEKVHTFIGFFGVREREKSEKKTFPIDTKNCFSLFFFFE